jgi:hypothetical protein
VGRTSGAQKIVCSKKACSGSAAKNQPPMLPEFAAHTAAKWRGCPIIALEIWIAAQALPRKAGYFCPLKTIIKID